MNELEEINLNEAALVELEEKRNELLLKDLFLKTKLIMDNLNIEKATIEKTTDLVSGDVFDGFTLTTIDFCFNDGEDINSYNDLLEKHNLTLQDMSYDEILKDSTKITIDTTFEEFKKRSKLKKVKSKKI